MNLPGRYKKLTKSVLAGGYGTVLPLEDSFLRRVVLLKVMQDAKNNTQLQNEIRGLCRARSRHVIEVYDVVTNPLGEVEGIIIERLRGRDFIGFYKEAAANPQMYLKVLYQVACALRDLHAVGIIHRDLKLDNFRESVAGVVKLFDFGISSEDGGYKTKQNKGTLVYAAPELFVPGAVVTPKMDVYAFGVCAWALASPVFPPQLLERPPQQSGRAPSLATVMPTVPTHAEGLHPEVVALLDACLHPAPHKRPSASHLSQILGNHLIRGRHKGLFVQYGAKVVELSAKQPTVNLKIGALGEIQISYDGLRFVVRAITGSVRINNAVVAVGDVLQEACLLSFGDPSLGPRQEWITFFASHPEVVL